MYQPDVICVTEFAPKFTVTPIQESELQIECYNLYTNIDCFKRGVLIYTSKILDTNPVDMKALADFDENVWVEIKLREQDKLLIGCVYRSPNSSASNNVSVMNGLQKICEQRRYSHILICGDFNMPEIDWEKETTSTSEQHVAYTFLECTKDCYLVQHVREPTHYRGDQKSNVLDLIFTNEEDMISDLKHEAPIGASHHSSLFFTFNCYTEQENKGKKTFRYNRGDYEELRRIMSQYNWEEVLQDKMCVEAWSWFQDAITEGMKKCIPQGYNKAKKPGRALWMNDEALAKVRKKSAAYKRYLETKEGEDYNQYARARNQARWACRRMKKEFEKKIAQEAKTNPKAFYNYVNSKLKVRSGVADLETDDGVATSDAQKAEALNKFFVSVFTREDLDTMPELPDKDDVNPLNEITIYEAAVEEKLKQLNPNKSSGPDELHPRVLSELQSVISKPLSIIMQKSLDEGILPQAWKDAHVSPIFKKGMKNKTNNYRPVSLTSVICKILESIIRDHIMLHIQKHDLLTKHQHGFVPGRSCSTQLVACLDIWTAILDRGSNMDAVYLDFSKAFDSVPHHRLCLKLQHYGIQGKVLGWLDNFLRNRRQKVVVNGQESQWENVISGVPQGSVIGPTLFILFINDMPEVVNCFIQLFADDAKVFSEIVDESQHNKLQEDLDSLLGWAERWQLVFNAKKCKVMHLGKNNKNFEYHMKEESLETTSCEKDLGVWVDNQLKLSTHAETQAKKANKILGLIRRSFTNLDKQVFCQLYKSLVRSHLEYTNSVTHPQYEKDAKLLENVQRRATKLVPELKLCDYPARMKALGLPSLLYRRRRGDMIEAYKYTHKIYDIEPSPLPLDHKSTTRGHSFKLEKRRAMGLTRQKFFTMRIVNDWNSLPETVVEAPSVNTFKNRLDKYWADIIYDTPNL